MSNFIKIIAAVAIYILITALFHNPIVGALGLICYHVVSTIISKHTENKDEV